MEILRKLVDSESKSRLLARLLERPGSVFSVSEMGRLADLPKASVSAIITGWERDGLVLSRLQGRNKLVSLNPKFYLLPELKRISEKTMDFQRPLMEELKSMPVLKDSKIRAVVVFGSRARGGYSAASDLDVLVAIENKNAPLTEQIVEGFVKSSERIGVRLSPTLLDKNEIKSRLREKDKFILNIFNEGKILKGGDWLKHLQTAP